MPVSYLKFVEDLSAGVKWLNGYYGRRLRGTYGILSDALMETSRQAFIQRLPGHEEQARDSLDACGHDRDLLFYAGETEEAWLERVVGAWDSYGYAATPQSVKVAVEAWGSATFPTTWVAGNVKLAEHNWRPDYDPSLRVWHDMLDATSYTVLPGAPATVTSITNKKSGVFWNTPSAIYPEYEAAGISGKPCMRGNEALQRGIRSLDPGAVSTFVGEEIPWTTIALVHPADQTLDDGVLISAANSVLDNRSAQHLISRQDNDKFQTVRYDDTAAATGVVGPAVSLVPQVLSVRVTGVENTLTINNGASVTSGVDLGMTTPNRVALFHKAENSLRAYWSGRLAEILVFAEGFTVAKAEEASLWLLAKWLGPSTTGVDFTVYISTASCGWTTAAFTYGSGRTYGDGSIYGSSALAKDVAMLKKTINKYKRGAARGRVVVYNTHPGDTVISFLV